MYYSNQLTLSFLLDQIEQKSKKKDLLLYVYGDKHLTGIKRQNMRDRNTQEQPKARFSWN